MAATEARTFTGSGSGMTSGRPAGGISRPTYSSGPHGTKLRRPSAAQVTRRIPPPEVGHGDDGGLELRGVGAHERLGDGGHGVLLRGMTTGAPEAGSTSTVAVTPKTSSITSGVTTCGGWPLGDDPPVAHGDQVVGVAGGHREVVQHHDDGGARRRRRAGARGRARRAGARCRGTRSARRAAAPASPGRAPWPARPAGAARRRGCRPARREVHQVGALQGRGDGLLVGAAPGAEQPVVRVASALDELEHADPLGHDRLLRQQAEPAGDLAGAQRADLVAVEQHRTTAGAQQPAQPAQQGRLPAPVGARRPRSPGRWARRG